MGFYLGKQKSLSSFFPDAVDLIAFCLSSSLKLISFV